MLSRELREDFEWGLKEAKLSIPFLIIVFGFVVDGFGLSVFNIGALGRRVDPLAVPIGITPRRNLVLGAEYIPEFCIIQDDQYRRSVYDLNGFYPYLRVPLFFNLDFIADLDPFIDQDFDIISVSDEAGGFKRSVVGRGGITGLNLGGEWGYRFLILGIKHSAFFGSSEEEWQFDVGEIVTRDTVFYDYSGGGWQFQVGALSDRLGVIGWGGWHDIYSDTLIASPVNFGVRINYKLKSDLSLILGFGYEKWADYSDQINVSGGLCRGRFSLEFAYLPWYYGVDEFGLKSSYQIVIGKVGWIVPGLCVSLRKDLGVLEYSISPTLNFQINELIGKRKRWF